MRRLVAALEPGTWVVFDGRDRELGEPDGVVVVWADEPGPNAADRVIAGIVEEDSDPSRWRVVTSDGELAARVRAAGASVMGAGEFRSDLGV